MGLDAEVRSRCAAVGLDIDEMLALDERSGFAAVFRTLAVAESNAETAAMDRAREQRAAAARQPVPLGVGSTRWRTTVGTSATLTIRFDHDELAELRRRAEVQGIGVSVLARSYVRKSLREQPTVVWE